MLPLWLIVLQCVFAGLTVAQNYRGVKTVVVSAAQTTEHTAVKIAGKKPPAQPHSLVYPDPVLTPCATELEKCLNPLIHANMDPKDPHNICSKKFKTGDYRDTTPAMKAEAYRRYGVEKGKRDCAYGCEVDHDIPLVAGGADVILNLWPEPAEPRPGFHEKDHLEDHVKVIVCALHTTQQRQAALDDFRQDIATDWLAACVKYKVKCVPPPVN